MNVDSIIQSGGLLLIGLIIFAESGMLVGFFLPGDTLLLAAGVFAAQGKLSLVLTIVVVALAAILGDNTGYTIGQIAGKRLLHKKDGIFFRHEYIERAEKFYERFGAKTMLLSHFVAIVRTFTPIVAGVAKMPRWQFFIFDAIGDIAWAIITVLLGYWFGSKIPNIDHYILPTVGVVTVICFAPVLWHIVGNRETRGKIVAKLRANRTPKDATPDSEK